MTNELEHNMVRNMSDAALMAAQMILGSPTRPALTEERNRQGNKYHRLRYRMPGDKSRKAVYLGRLSDDELNFLAMLEDERWENRGTSRAKLVWKYNPDICQLKVQLDHGMERARALAAKCGYHFMGYELRRYQDRAQGLPVKPNQADLLALTDTMIHDVQPCLAYLALCYKGLALEMSLRLSHQQLRQNNRPSRAQQRMLGVAQDLEIAKGKIVTAINQLQLLVEQINQPEPL